MIDIGRDAHEDRLNLTSPFFWLEIGESMDFNGTFTRFIRLRDCHHELVKIWTSYVEVLGTKSTSIVTCTLFDNFVNNYRTNPEFYRNVYEIRFVFNKL